MNPELKRQEERVVELLERYDRPGPRYTSYPTAVEFRDGFSESDYREQLGAASAEPLDPVSLYTHLPFCEERCAYCGCHVIATRRRDVAGRYETTLVDETRLVAEAWGGSREVSQFHWGGGTPTYLDPEQMEALFAAMTAVFPTTPDAEIAVELDPRVTTVPHVDALARMGFNRLSMGVQDFSVSVQEAIGRNQTEEQTRTLLEQCRERGFRSINFDLVYGLPRQTLESFRGTIARVVELRPERLALYSYAHLPSIRPNQRRIDPAELPEPRTKLRLFGIARALLLDAGYVEIGMDHFALPEDELAQAAVDGRLYRNFMGYSVRRASDTIGLGLSAISAVSGCFSQNFKKLSDYTRAIESGRLPVERGCRLDDDDRIRADVIRQLICLQRVDVPSVEQRHGIEFGRYFAEELRELTAAGGPVEHGFARVEPNAIRATDEGRLLLRNLCLVFDRYRRGTQGGSFSRTI